MTVSLNQVLGRAGKVSVDEEVHGFCLLCRQGMMLFLLYELAGVFQRCSYIFLTDPILPGNLLNCHSSCQPADDTHDWHPGSTNDRLAMLNFGIDHNTVVHKKNFL